MIRVGKQSLTTLKADCPVCQKIFDLLKELNRIDAKLMEYGFDSGIKESLSLHSLEYRNTKKKIEETYETCLHCKKDCYARRKAGEIFWRKCFTNE